MMRKEVSKSVTVLPVAWHVGRHGEVAGGMTQVVNGYLGWAFERMAVSVIATRDGSKGFAAVKVFFRGLSRFFKIRDAQANVFIVHLSQGGSFIREGLLLWLAHLRGFGTVAHIHGSRFVIFAQRFPFLVKFVLQRADKIIVLSDATFNKIAELVPPDRILLVPNAVPAGTPSPKSKTIVFGGSVSLRKGVDVLVKAWAAVKDKNGWELLVAGPVADPEVVPESLDAATFLGSVTHGQLMQMLEHSSVAVLPSRDEAMPMFILEALARDNCVISTRVGGIPALLSENKGVLVDAGSVEQLKEALERVIKEEAYRTHVTSLGRAAFDASFSAQTIYPRVETLWLSVIPKV